MNDWMHAASCAQTDPEVFFPGPSEPYQHALDVCASCPVIEACRAYIDRIEGAQRSTTNLHGIWAGETPNRRLDRRRKEAA